MEVIRLDQVSLWRRTQEEFSYDFKKTVLSLLQGKYHKPSKKLVLDRIDLAIEQGEKVGIIGANGAGKSTLLKVICGILEPTSGSVRVRGNIAPLIELGAGFNAEMSLINNIIVYGVLLGYSKAEMKVRTPAILEFAELQDYAHAPVKALSSGMMARLGFAVATDIEPDILILDEILSVGDVRFAKKSKERIEKLWNHSSTILFVSHSLPYIAESCEKAIWLDRGRIVYSGSAEETVERYLSAVN
ncbi:MAG: ABC transporter ATP-binding protein [Cyanobacteriota bacterium]|nr:ABC transporter ATP-binding protein [Cyanobacteriota bacterium]